MMKLSEAAQSALIDAGSNRQGTVVKGSLEVHRELEAAALAGPFGGLTRKGSIERERLVSRRLDEAFG